MARRRRSGRVVVMAALVAATAMVLQSSAQQRSTLTSSSPRAADAAPALELTSHPSLPRDLSQLWYAPAGGRTPSIPAAGAGRDFAGAMDLVDKEDYARALRALAAPSLAQGPLAGYAIYYAGVSQLGLEQPGEARRSFQRVREQSPAGYLAEAAAIGEAKAAQSLGEPAAAVAIYEQLAKVRTTAPDAILMRLGLAAKERGDTAKAAEAFGRVYFEYPNSEFAGSAGSEYDAIPTVQRLGPGNARYKLELGRAERLYGARQYLPARAAFQKLLPVAAGDDRELVDLRLAECEHFLRRWRIARDLLSPQLERTPRRAEALYFYAASIHELGAHTEYLMTIRRVIDEFPAESWAEDALNSLATHYVVQDEDDLADATFRALLERFPKSRYAERAVWKVGWRAYREGRFADTVRFFERGATDFPRSDYRPSWLYWAGRAHERLGAAAPAEQRFTLVTADYLNSYYGRLASKALGGRHHPPRVFGETPAAETLSNQAVVRALLGAGRYGDAQNELRYAQRIWGDSPAIQATQAWISAQLGQSETGSRKFTLVRGSITQMRRAYPQFMASGGEELPPEVLKVIFPLAYWDLIKRHSAANNLDPYLVAALVAQESTFVADIRSHANAYGLMQIVPATGRRLARQLKLTYSTRLLTNAEASIRMGTFYLAQKIDEFGALHLALASYNAGETAVRRWIAERPGVHDPAEFVDDIPYSETRNVREAAAGHDGRLSPPVRVWHGCELGQAGLTGQAGAQGRRVGKLTGSRKATQFTESVIREMTRLNQTYGGVNLSQGFPDFPAPAVVKDAACAAIQADVNQYAVTWGTRALREAIARDLHPSLRRARRRRRAGHGVLRRHRGDDGHPDGHHRSRRRSGDLRAVLRELRPGRHPVGRDAPLRHAARARLAVRSRRARRRLQQPDEGHHPEHAQQPHGQSVHAGPSSSRSRRSAASGTWWRSPTRSTSTSSTTGGGTCRSPQSTAWPIAPSRSTACRRRTA